MYYKLERKYNLLKIDDNFALLKNIRRDGLYEFEFRYKVPQADVIKQKATTVEVSVITKTIKKKPIIGISTIGKIDAKEVIKNVLSDMASAKSALKHQENYVIQSKNSDITAHINNEIVSMMAAGKTVDNIPQTYTHKLRSVSAGSLKESNDVKPVLDFMNMQVDNIHNQVSSSYDQETKKLSQSMILKHGLDPSEVANLDAKVGQSFDSFQGTFKPSNVKVGKNSTMDKLHDHVMLNKGIQGIQASAKEMNENQLINVVISEPVRDVEVPVTVKFFPPKKVIGSKDSVDVFVKFILKDSNTGSAIDSVTIPLDIPKHTRFYWTPTSAPVVKVTKAEISSKVNLEIKQTSVNANEVHVFKKVVHTTNVQNDDYVLVGVHPVTENQRIIVSVDMPLKNAYIYRVIPAHSGVLGYSYNNIVIRPKRYTPVTAISLTSHVIDEGLQLEARHLPPETISVQFLQRNLTVFEKEFTSISEPILIEDTTRRADYVSYIASNVQTNHVYEFACRIYQSTGVQMISGNEIIEYILPEPGKIDVTVRDIIVSHDDEPNVSFTVDVNILDSNIDLIKSMLEKQGIKSYFEGDIAKQRDQLKSLLSYSVHRIDLNTGVREDLGVITQPTFNDKNVRRIYSASSLKYGHKYRYQITPLARAPETLFDAFKKTSQDPVTKKAYSFEPSKFLHPITKKTGMIVTAAGLATKFSKNAFEHGAIGATHNVEITLDQSPSIVADPGAEKINRYYNSVSWKLQGELSNVDHFIIMKEFHGMRVLLGTAHSSFQHGHCQWLHKLGPRDKGEIKYVIVPVLNDYKHGNQITSNSLVIE